MEPPTLHVVVPVFNEEDELADHVRLLARHLEAHLGDFDWRITVADNASIDRTLAIAQELSRNDPRIAAVHLPEKGRGRAVKHVWTHDPADVVAYMDVDLSSDLAHFPSLVRSLLSGYDIAIGTRNLPASRVHGRSLLRTITSKAYLFLIRLVFPVHFSDAQCGFKAVTRRVAETLVPRIVDDEWFFDTELLVMGELTGLRIYEEPVTWTDNPGSTVRVWKTATADLRGLWRLFVSRPWKTSRHGHG
ncbi:MAG: glycosyltransferase [Acidobacteriota bacterium]|nr:glycosyltransferase [Acidobacteriota bacterium]